LCTEEFTFQVERFIFDVIFLEREQFEVSREFREFEVEILRGWWERREESGLICYGRGEGRILFKSRRES